MGLITFFSIAIQEFVYFLVAEWRTRVVAVRFEFDSLVEVSWLLRSSRISDAILCGVFAFERLFRRTVSRAIDGVVFGGTHGGWVVFVNS